MHFNCTFLTFLPKGNQNGYQYWETHFSSKKYYKYHNQRKQVNLSHELNTLFSMRRECTLKSLTSTVNRRNFKVFERKGRKRKESGHHLLNAEILHFKWFIIGFLYRGPSKKQLTSLWVRKMRLRKGRCYVQDLQSKGATEMGQNLNWSLPILNLVFWLTPAFLRTVRERPVLIIGQALINIIFLLRKGYLYVVSNQKITPMY